MERRSAPRINIRVQMEGKKNGDIFQGTSINLSETGVLIEANKMLSLGDRVTIRFILAEEHEIVGAGQVVRQEMYDKDRFGLAVHWELTREEREEIADMIEESEMLSRNIESGRR